MFFTSKFFFKTLEYRREKNVHGVERRWPDPLGVSEEAKAGRAGWARGKGQPSGWGANVNKGIEVG